MTAFLDRLADAGPDLVLRATLLFGVAALLSLALSRGSAAWRHLVWGAALGGSLVLMVARFAAPSAWPVWPVAPAIESPVGPVVWMTVPDVPVTPQPVEIANVTQTRPTPESRGFAAPTLPVTKAWPLRRVLALLWCAGCVLGVAPLVAGTIRLRRLARRAVPVAGREARLLDELRRECGIRRSVGGWIAREPVVPMTWGWLRPVVLLPPETLEWSKQRLRVVLLHELSHIRREDFMTQWIAGVARSVYWFHPLAWWGAARMRVEQEAACDDSVLSRGLSAPDYAEELLAVTARLPAGLSGGHVALAMGRAARIEARVRTILAGDRDRRPVGRASSTLVALSFAVLAALVAIAGPALQPHAAQADDKAADQAAKSEPAPKAADPAPAAKPAPQQPGVPKPPDSDEVLRQVLDQIDSNAALAPERAKLREAAIRGMLSALRDPYSELIDQRQIEHMQTAVSGKLAGIGLVLEGDKAQKEVRVRQTIPGSPAEKAGFQPGERVTAVGDTQVESVEDAAKGIRGAPGTDVVLTVVGEGNAERKVTVRREEIQLPTVRGLLREPGGTWRHWLDADAKLGYLAIAGFGPKTAAETRSILDRLQADGMKGLVLDLRNNPGGLLNVCIETAQLFLSNAEVVRIIGREGQPAEVLKVSGDAPFGKVPLVVLVDDTTGSAAEVLTGALQDNKRGVIVGERTHGKGSIQAILPAGGESLKLTVRLMTTPAGRPFNRGPDATVWGIDPNPGFYFPTDAEARRGRIEKLVLAESGRLLADKNDPNGGKGPFTPERIARDLADKPLSLAVDALRTRVATGGFQANGRPLEEQTARLKEQSELRKEREMLRARLSQLDRALGEGS